MLVSYVDKKKSGKRNVVVLSTMHNSVSVTKDQRVKPNVHTFCDHTKGGVDVVDLVSPHNTTKMKTRKWPVNALAFILDTVHTKLQKPSFLSRNHQLFILHSILLITLQNH